MTSREFIAAEAENTDRITLYREGLFWKAYERSAFAVCAQVRGFKPTKKALKSLGGGLLISIGFPTRNETAVLDGLQRLTEEENRLVLQTPRPIVGREFEAWKASIPVAHNRRPTKEGARRAASHAQRAKNPRLRFDDHPGEACEAGSERMAGRGPAAMHERPVMGPERPATMRERLAAGHGGTSSEAGAHAPGLRATSAEHAEARPESPNRYGEADFSLAEACRIADAIRGFNLAEKTPMECMLFVAELKKSLSER